MNVAAASTSAGGGTASIIITLVIILAAIALYWVPTFVAYGRKVPNVGSIVVWNFFGFFFFVPWIVALAKALADPARRGA